MQKTLNPRVVIFLIERYPGSRSDQIRDLYESAWVWIEQTVSPEYMIPKCMPDSLEAAALLWVQTWLVPRADSHTKASLLFCAHELLQPYRRRA